MNGLYSCIIAISMYSKIPMPNVEWTEERMRYVMCFFPLVGIVQGKRKQESSRAVRFNACPIRLQRTSFPWPDRFRIW